MSARETMISLRAENCIREILFTAIAERPTGDAGAYADRAQVLTNLRRIKLKAIEAEVLLRSLDRQDLAQQAITQFAGSSSIRAPGSFPPGDAVSNPSPAPLRSSGGAR